MPLSMEKFPFPFVREPQKEMIADVRSALEQSKHLIADAPTGIGKTVASLFPAVEFAVENDKNIFFLTSRLSQHKMALDTLKMMKSKGMKFSAVDIVGKRHLCSHDVEDLDSSTFNSFCNSLVKEKRCPYYSNFRNDRLEAERTDFLRAMNRKGPLDSEEALALLSDKYCTYEMLMEAAKKADVVIGDYFHLFGMGERFLKRMGKNLNDSIVIVDEAHNLADRLRGYLSATISTRTLESALREAESKESEAVQYIEHISVVMKDLAANNLFETHEVFLSKDEFSGMVSETASYDDIIKSLAEVAENVLEERKVSFADRLSAFLEAWKGDDYGYARILSRKRIRNADHVALYYNCLDPSIISKSIIDPSHSTILMSGTLSPAEMHRDLLGLEEKRTIAKSYRSPFPAANRKNIIVKGITTKFTERNEENFRKIALNVAECISAVRGNVAVFFPSYEMRDNIVEIAKPEIGKYMILESRTMTKEEKDRVKSLMKAHSKNGAALLGVMGGSFSEGIDLPGDLLNGVVIVGLPLGRPDLTTKALIEYYDERFQRGMSYGYTYPAIVKVVQAAGRCIRTETDRGVIVFADERFLWRNYRHVFPKTWQFEISEQPGNVIRKFFENSTKM